MKISELEKILKRIREDNGDIEIILDISDYYSRYGSFAHFILEKDIDNSCLWTGIKVANHSKEPFLLLSASIDDKDEFNGSKSHPKITFRK